MLMLLMLMLVDAGVDEDYVDHNLAKYDLVSTVGRMRKRSKIDFSHVALWAPPAISARVALSDSSKKHE
eukprot:7102637-Pyramimonas_sp.AAC.1